MQNTLLFDFEMKYDSPVCIYSLIIVIVLRGDAYKSNYFYVCVCLVRLSVSLYSSRRRLKERQY